MIGEDELKQSLQCSMRPDVGIANDYRCDADIAMKVVRLGIVERSCIITSRQSSQLLMHLQFALSKRNLSRKASVFEMNESSC